MAENKYYAIRKTIELFLVNGTADSIIMTKRNIYYWTTAIIFVGRDLDKILIRYLENRLVEIAKNCRRYKVLTKNTFRV